MFAIIDGQLVWADPKDTRYHMDWFVQEGWISREEYSNLKPGKFEGIVRGFLDDRGLFAYRGRDFTHFGCYQAMSPIVDQFLSDLPGTTKVYLGVISGSNGYDWDGKIFAGNLQEFVL